MVCDYMIWKDFPRATKPISVLLFLVEASWLRNESLIFEGKTFILPSGDLY